jgi:quinol monooxygenase YgiN
MPTTGPRALVPEQRCNRQTDQEGTVTFIQTIAIATDRIDAVESILDEWITATTGERTAQRATLTTDRDHPDTYMQIVEFPSYDAAMENSRLAQTSRLADRLGQVCKAEPVFHNLDVRRVDELV